MFFGEVINKMLGIISASILDAEVINNEADVYWSRFVFEYIWCLAGGDVAVSCQMLD